MQRARYLLFHLDAGSDLLRPERSYDIALVAKFASLEDLHAYQVHPTHVQIAEYIKTRCEHSVSVDYLSGSNKSTKYILDI
jgi:hypothetical protein